MNKKLLLVATSMLFAITSVHAMPFGGKDDVAYAKKLWSQMSKNNLVGEDAIMSTPYVGLHPHGAILDTIDAKVKVGDNNGVVIIKRNYGGKDVSKMSVANNPSMYLKAVTVMYKRDGYDADNKDWFWVKYSPKGDVLKNPKNMSLAGRVAKGANEGCIACHTAAPGGDLVYNHDRYINMK
jgi:hypothetical protein